MVAPGRERRLGRIPSGLVGMLVLVALVESFVARNADMFMTPHELDWRAGQRVAAGRAARAQILIFGDSMLKFGLNPRILQEQIGRPAYSLALLDGKPPASYYLFRRALAAGARPKAVVVDFQPECMFQPTWSMLKNRHWKGLFSLGECLDMAWTYRDASFFAQTALAVLLPSARCRGEIRAGALAALKGETSTNPAENAKVARNRAANLGAMLLAKKPEFQGEIPASYGWVMFSSAWFNQPEATAYVRRFMKLAQHHGIPVFWVLPPNTPKVQARRDEAGLSARYDRFVQAVQARYPHLRVIDARRAGFGHDLFVDPVHLDRDGATSFSLEVADVLRPIVLGTLETERAHDRWVTLSRRGSRRLSIALEDVDQSRAAVGAVRR